MRLLPGPAALLACSLLLHAAPASAEDDQRWREVMERSFTVGREQPHSGRLVMASFGPRGPNVTEVDITRGDGGGVLLARRGRWELGRVGEEGFVRWVGSGTLLRLDGIERADLALDRIDAKYAVTVTDVTELDTGPARCLELRQRTTEAMRERLCVDERTGVMVRRETHDLHGAPLRVVAYTLLESESTVLQAPPIDETPASLSPADIVALRADGFSAPDELAGGYERIGGYVLSQASVPTLHLVYSDGLYTLSLYEQEGRLAASAARRGVAVRTSEGATVHTWPGSEPRRVVWTAAGRTFTMLSDAPDDELLAVVAGLPNDPGPSILGRLGNGLRRLGGWLWPAGGD